MWVFQGKNDVCLVFHSGWVDGRKYLENDLDILNIGQ